MHVAPTHFAACSTVGWIRDEHGNKAQRHD